MSRFDAATLSDTLSLSHTRIAHSRRLYTQMEAVIERSLDLMWWARLGLEKLPPPGRLILGGSDVAMVADLIATAKLCLHCIARKTGVPAPQVTALLTATARSLRLRIGPHRCDACLEHKTTFSVTKDGQPNGGGSRNETILGFLEQHRGEAFCSGCVASTLFGGKPVDYAIRQIEGTGARRFHGTCSACGKQRLVCGLKSL